MLYSPFEHKRKPFDLTSLRKNVTAISTGERLFRDFATAYSIDANRVSPANPPEMNEKIFNQRVREHWLQERNEKAEWLTDDDRGNELSTTPLKNKSTLSKSARHFIPYQTAPNRDGEVDELTTGSYFFILSFLNNICKQK